MVIKHRSFSFYKPKLPSEKEYFELKRKIESNPELILYRNIGFWEYFGEEIKKRIFYPMGIALLSIILMVITEFALFEWISAILCLYLFAVIFIYGIWEWGSYIVSNQDRKSYYTKLKSKIIKSDDYEDFIRLNKFWRIGNLKK